MPLPTLVSYHRPYSLTKSETFFRPSLAVIASVDAISSPHSETSTLGNNHGRQQQSTGVPLSPCRLLTDQSHARPHTGTTASVSRRSISQNEPPPNQPPPQLTQSAPSPAFGICSVPAQGEGTWRQGNFCLSYSAVPPGVLHPGAWEINLPSEPIRSCRGARNVHCHEAPITIVTPHCHRQMPAAACVSILIPPSRRASGR
jgi:hypothetical protein